MKGLFITIEGIDGSGKSTLSRNLSEELKKNGRSVVTTRAPGGTDFGVVIRDILLHGHLKDVRSELFLFLADRAEHVSTLIRPALEEGKIVICDRYNDSTAAYQSERGLDISKVSSLCHFATEGLTPDLTILVDLEPEIAYQRVEKVRHKDRIENEGLYLLTKIRKAYLELARQEARFVIVDGQLSISELLAVCMDHVNRLIDSKYS